MATSYGNHIIYIIYHESTKKPTDIEWRGRYVCLIDLRNLFLCAPIVHMPPFSFKRFTLSFYYHHHYANPYSQITIMIIPTSTGKVFISDEMSVRYDNPPTQKLKANHPFVPFVEELWHKITTPGAANPLMDAYAMLLFDIDTVPDACRQYICTQLRQTPPDIVLIDGLNPRLRGFHQRTPITVVFRPIVRAMLRVTCIVR